MEPLIGLLVLALVFCAIAYGAWWLCKKFEAPKPVLWVVGVILLVFLLVWASRYLSGGAHLVLF
jgi:hypothetical protein